MKKEKDEKKKDKGKKNKKKDKVKEDSSDSAKVSKKSKVDKDKKDKKAKKDKKKEKKPSVQESDDDLERDVTELPTTNEILRISQEEDLEGAIRFDTFILLDSAIRNKLQDNIKNIFKQFQQS